MTCANHRHRAARGKSASYNGSVLHANPCQAQHIRRLYLRRWRAEEGIRFLKGGLGLERVRVVTWRRLQHMMALALLAMTVIALALDEPHHWRTQLIAQGKPRQTPAKFLFYRILK